MLLDTPNLLEEIRAQNSAIDSNFDTRRRHIAHVILAGCRIIELNSIRLTVYAAKCIRNSDFSAAKIIILRPSTWLLANQPSLVRQLQSDA